MKKKIAIVAGGDSGEFEVSIKSSGNIINSIDTDKFIPYLIIITGRDWVYKQSDDNDIPVDKNDFSINIYGKKITFDCVLITIHGTPGEDGKLQGYFELLKIPYTTAGLMQSALTFNKYYTNQLVSYWGFPVAKNVKLLRSDNYNTDQILKKVSLPVFVKPNKGGSSLGTDKADSVQALEKNIRLAFEHDDEILIEEFLPGRELTCGAFKYKGEVIALPVTEIIPKADSTFFDFNAKYNKQSDEITPANITEELTKEIQISTRHLYEKLDLFGLVRFDYIVCDEIVYFLEVNTIPGMTDESLVPQQAEAAGISSKDLFTMILEESLKKL